MPDGKALTVRQKAGLAARVWARFAVISIDVRRKPLPDLIAELRQVGEPRGNRHSPTTLAKAVDRSLRIGRHRPRCLINALVLFRLLREQGEQAELVIGLPNRPTDERAHAWVELRGRDVGPPPGRAGHEEIARLS